MIGARAAWKLLGIAPTSDVSAVRRAYADRLRALDEGADPAAFDRLRDAREVALTLARSREDPPSATGPVDDDPDPYPPGLSVPAVGLGHAPRLDRPAARRLVDAAPPLLPADRCPPLVDRVAADARATLDAALPSTAAVWRQVTLGDGRDDAQFVQRRPEPRDIVEAAYRNLADVLHPGGQQGEWALDDAERATIDAALDAITRDPRLEELEFRADAEQWLATILADAIPRSDPVLHRVATAFGWTGQGDRIGAAPAVQQVVARVRTLVFVAAVERRGHGFNGAWRAMTEPGEGWRPWRVGRRGQRALLTHIRRHHPDAEGWLDPYRVGRVEHAVGGPGVPWWGAGLIVVGLLRLCSAMMTPEGGVTPAPWAAETPVAVVGQPVAGLSQPLGDLDADLDLALLPIANGFTAARLRAENPALYAEVATRWRTAKAAGVRSEPFARTIAAYLDGQLRHAIAHAAYADIAAYRRLDLDLVRTARDRGIDDCAPTPAAAALLLGQAGELKRRDLIVRLLLAGRPGIAPSGPRTFRVPGDVIRRIMADTRLSEDRVGAALSQKGTPAAICATHEALLAAALALPPRRGLPLLRAM